MGSLEAFESMNRSYEYLQGSRLDRKGHRRFRGKFAVNLNDRRAFGRDSNLRGGKVREFLVIDMRAFVNTRRGTGKLESSKVSQDGNVEPAIGDVRHRCDLHAARKE